MNGAAIGKRIIDDQGRHGMIVDNVDGVWHALLFYGNSGYPIVQALDESIPYTVLD